MKIVTGSFSHLPLTCPATLQVQLQYSSPKLHLDMLLIATSPWHLYKFENINFHNAK